MAISLVAANRGSVGALATPAAGSNGNYIQVDLPAGASITVGNYLIATCAYDNSGTAGVDPNMFVASSIANVATPYLDLRGNYWFRIAKQVRTSGGANDGAVADIWMTRVRFAYTNGDDITFQFSFTQAGVAIRISEFSGLDGLSYSVVTPITGTGNGTTIGPTGTITPTVVGQMVLGVAAIETNTAITGDADTTDGSWVTLGNNAYNSGVDATSQTLFSQHKIVTGLTAQDWDVTKAGAADWAALAVVFGVFVNADNGFVVGNPNFPCIVGPEVLPIAQAQIPLDTGTEYLFDHKVFPNDYGSQDYRPASQTIVDFSRPSATVQAHTMAFDVYLKGNEEVVDPIETAVLPLSAVIGSGGTVSVVGAASGAIALAYPGAGYVLFGGPSGGYVDVTFDTTTLTTVYPNNRIVRWGLRYLAWKDDSSPTEFAGVGEGIKVQWHDNSANNGAGAFQVLGAWLVQGYERNAQYETRWLGEANLVNRGKGAIVTSELGFGASFTINDLSHMAGSTAFLRISGEVGEDLLQTDVYLDYVQLWVEMVPERRLASSMRRIVQSPSLTSIDIYPTGGIFSPTYTVTNTATRWTVPSADNDYVLAAREALPSSPSDYYASRTTGGRSLAATEAIGPPILMAGIYTARETLDPYPNLRQAGLSVGRIVSPPTELPNLNIDLTAVDYINFPFEGAFWASYAVASPGTLSQVYTGHSLNQRILPDAATYTRVKLLVQPDELTTANLTVTIEQPTGNPIATATVTTAAALAQPDLGDGWREVSVGGFSVNLTATDANLVLSSTTTSAAPWYAALGFTSFVEASYYVSQSDDDLAIVLECPLATPSTSIGQTAYPLYRPTDRCLATTVALPTVTLTNGADYDWVLIERGLDGMNYQGVVLLQDPTNAQVWTDFGAPWGVEAGTITYRVTGYRNSDHLSATATTIAVGNVIDAPGAAFGLAVPNEGLYAYIPTVESGDLEITYNPMNPIQSVPLHELDYQIALRAPEERGLSVTVSVLTDRLVSCPEPTDDFDPEVLEPGASSFSPTPFDQIRALENEDLLELILPGGHTRFVTLKLGTMNIRTQFGVYLTEITLTDAPNQIAAPYDAVNT